MFCMSDIPLQIKNCKDNNQTTDIHPSLVWQPISVSESVTNQYNSTIDLSKHLSDSFTVRQDTNGEAVDLFDNIFTSLYHVIIKYFYLNLIDQIIG